ncbi:hypothetical protein GCM10011386_07370 [Parapedobacter defluvii]|uniref:DUF4142 domain-containing protein n=1 Tax=Parapedobacter defluvii TaxID=2045106 RepID=A0ABQ1L7T9_9SPHI|nr:hypothetical protein [Parapedobacter defluvii]GGC17950.1 hypothetical protein GCM10011386_07370 [Parapedobacter defluvii]
MKFRKIVLMALPLAVAASSCTRHAGESESRTKLYNNATDVDSEGFSFFKSVHKKATFEVGLANYVQSSPASAEAKKLAAGIVETYEPIIAELEDMGASFHVILPDPGVPAFAVPHHFAADSLGGFDSKGYIAHAQHEQGAILEQFNRIDRNTSKVLKTYAKEKLPAVKEVFALAGGHEEHGAHH